MLVWVAWLPGVMVISRSKLLSRGLSVSVVLLQLGSVLIFMAQDTTGDQRNLAC